MGGAMAAILLRPYGQRVKAFLPLSGASAGMSVKAILAVGDAVWVGGDAGLFLLRGDDVERVVDLPEEATAVRALGCLGDGKLVAGTSAGLFETSASGPVQVNGWRSGEAVSAICPCGEKGLFGAGEGACFRLSAAGQIELIEHPVDRRISCVAVDASGRPLVGTDRGMWVLDAGAWRPIFLKESVGYYLERQIAALAVDGAGQIWVSDGDSLAVLTNQYAWHAIRHEHGLPVTGIRAIALGPLGETWVGSSMGAARLQNGRWSYYASKRWLQSDEVERIDVDPQGTAWIGTREGLSRIGTETMTLEKKTEFFEKVVRTRHWRNGYVASSILDRPGDLSSWRQEASDNDGCWTSVYLSAQCFRYAATGDVEAKEIARQAFQSMFMLEALTPIPGFVARSVIRKGERVVQSGGEWHETEDGEWLWKADTSSDELAGHFFAYSVYHDLVADEAERRRTADLAARVMDHLMEHDFNLTDVDGEHTTWGVYSPHLLNAPGWEPQKGLNSLEILSHLKATHHMTGEEKYLNAYLNLVDEHHYALNTIDQQIPVPKGVPWDHELAFLAYYPLLRYEKEPSLRNIYLQSLERTWKWVEKEHCPFWTFIYGWATGHPIRLYECVQWLQDVPLDMICWSIRNSARKDIELHPERDFAGRLIAKNPIPMSERRISKLDGSPYELNGGADGRTEDDGAFFLLCYWAGRYLGFLEEA